jgi:catechol 2,3-dioxygenase
VAESKLDPATHIGAVELTVPDLDRSVDFYSRVIGLEPLGREDGFARVGAGGDPLVVLHGDPDAPPRPDRSTGLFHVAILLPDRVELGRALLRLAANRWQLTGVADHLVSEALYLNDPDGIGIELYRDRAREEWTDDAGNIRMATLPLDLDSIAAEARGETGERVADATRVGHVHLNVADLAASEGFYAGDLGFDVTVRNYPGALFVSAGGYHHHLGMNTWRGAPPPPEGAIGLRRYTVVSAGAEERELTDPSGNRLLVTPG